MECLQQATEDDLCAKDQQTGALTVGRVVCVLDRVPHTLEWAAAADPEGRERH